MHQVRSTALGVAAQAKVVQRLTVAMHIIATAAEAVNTPGSTGSTSRSVVGSQNSLCLVVGEHGTLRHLCHIAMSGGGRATPLVVLAPHAAIGDGPAQARGSRPLNQRTHTALEN